jgi:argininosuccinate lyase
VGRIVLHAIDRGVELQDLSLDEFRQFSSAIDAEVFNSLTLEQTLASKAQVGGTSRARVAEALTKARNQLAADKRR